jgi:hypothetical protein
METLHGHEKNAKNGRKEPEHLLFPIFGFWKASRVRFPKPISVSHSGIIAMKCLRPSRLRVIDDGTEMAALDRRMKMEKKNKPRRTPLCVGQATTRTNRKSQDQLTTEHNFYL